MGTAAYWFTSPHIAWMFSWSGAVVAGVSAYIQYRFLKKRQKEEKKTTQKEEISMHAKSGTNGD